MSNRVIAYKNLPTKPPILLTVVAWLVLDHIHASSFQTGVVITLLAIVWISYLVSLFTQELVDVVGQEKRED